jgi:hypothetical protein
MRMKRLIEQFKWGRSYYSCCFRYSGRRRRHRAQGSPDDIAVCEAVVLRQLQSWSAESRSTVTYFLRSRQSKVTFSFRKGFSKSTENTSLHLRKQPNSMEEKKELCGRPNGHGLSQHPNASIAIRLLSGAAAETVDGKSKAQDCEHRPEACYQP